VAVVLHLPCVVVPLHLIGVDSGPSLGEGSLPSTLVDLDEGRGKAQKGLPQQIRPSNLGWCGGAASWIGHSTQLPVDGIQVLLRQYVLL